MVSSATFLNLPDYLDGDEELRIVVFGAGHGTTYPNRDSSDYALAPDAIRLASQEDAELVEGWDFDLGGPLFGNGPVCCIDVGDLKTSRYDNDANRAIIEAKTREILAQSAVPILMGGDDSVPIPFLAAFASHGPIWVLQIYAHLDWRDEVDHERFGYSSPMRRTSEMDHVVGMIQVGMRSVGSARPTEVEAALRYGSHIVTAREVHAQGVEVALRQIPKGAQVVITLDCDGLDPAFMSGVAAPTPGGLSYTQVIDLIAGASRRGKIAGFDLVELTPSADPSGLSALTASRILVNVIGAVVRQG